MRDNYKDKEYFNDFIENTNLRLKKRFYKLDNKLIKLDRVNHVKRDMFKSYNQLISAKYSRGDNMFFDDVKKDYHFGVTLLSESWNKKHMGLIPSQVKKGFLLKQYSQSLFNYLLDSLSLGILLGAKDEDFNLIVDFIDKDEVKDFLIEFLIQYKNEERESIGEESYREFFGINDTYGTLKRIIKTENKDKAQKSLKIFLENEWFDSFKNEHIYSLHTGNHKNYSGYWCFVAAAIVKIKGLDDSSFRDNQYYPKDLG